MLWPKSLRPCLELLFSRFNRKTDNPFPAKSPRLANPAGLECSEPKLSLPTNDKNSIRADAACFSIVGRNVYPLSFHPLSVQNHSVSRFQSDARRSRSIENSRNKSVSIPRKDAYARFRGRFAMKSFNDKETEALYVKMDCKPYL